MGKYEFTANNGTYLINNAPQEKDISEIASMIKDLVMQDIESFPVGTEFDYFNLLELFEVEAV